MNKSNDSKTIRDICDKYDITQSDLARQTGKTRQYISNIVNGKMAISKELFDNLKQLYPSVFPVTDFKIPNDITNTTVKELRDFYKLSKAALAEMLNVSPSLIGHIEKGERNISRSFKKKLKDTFRSKNNNILTFDEFTNRNDVTVITIDKTTKYLLIKLV